MPGRKAKKTGARNISKHTGGYVKTGPKTAYRNGKKVTPKKSIAKKFLGG